MINAIFSSDGRMSGYATEAYRPGEEKTVKEVTKEELASIFDASSVEELAGTGEPISEAVENPLRFRDFLVLDSEGKIAFDDAYVRESDGGSGTAE